MEENIKDDKIQENEYIEPDFSVEKRNYSKLSFKKLHKLRVDGVAFGIDIPILQHDLKKPEKPRKVFTIYGIISSIILGLGIFAAGWLIAAILPPLLESTGALTNATSNPLISVISLGLSDLFGGLIGSLVWGLVLLLVVILGSIIYFLIYFVRAYFNLSKCSIQEMAVGYEATNLMTCAIVLTVFSGIATGGLIYLFTLGNPGMTLIYIIFAVIVVVFAYSISMIVFIALEKKKAKEIFKSMPIEEQESFIEHNRAINRVKYRISRMKSKDGTADNWYFY